MDVLDRIVLRQLQSQPSMTAPTGRRRRGASLVLAAALVAATASSGQPFLVASSGEALASDIVPTALNSAVPPVDEALAFAEHQILRTENRLPVTAHPVKSPADHAGGQWQTADRRDWRAAFFAGSEWLMFERFRTSAWRTHAEARTADFASEVSRPQTHDVGFKTIASYGNAYRLTNAPSFKHKIFDGADTLAARFMPEYGVTRSWDDTNGNVRVIIDNMMNLEAFFLAAELTSNAADRDRWLDMAVSHAVTTERNHIRDSADPAVDGSTCHVYYYNLGVCRKHQGLTDSSTWTRGQAWAAYGYTMAYEYTQRYPHLASEAALFLATAQRTADLFLRRLSEARHGDWVAMHDFDAPVGYPKDTSAMAIVASGLLGLSHLPAVPAAKRSEYKLAAENILTALSSPSGSPPYREASPVSGLDGESILLRATSRYLGPDSTMNTDIERALSYADYYFVEALLRYEDMYGSSPRSPTFVAGTHAAGTSSLTWTGTRGAAGYTVYRGTAAGGPYAEIGTSVAPSYTDSTAAAGTTYRYVVRATNDAGHQSGDSNEVTLGTPVVGWSTGDIGEVGAAGSSEDAAGTVTVRGAGADVYGTTDAFLFHRRQVTGDFTIVARVTGLQNTHAFAKAGLMARETLGATARNVYAHVTPTVANGHRLQWRTSAGGTTARKKVGTGSAPVWLRLTRRGSTFKGSYSSNGTAWTTIGSKTNAMPSTVHLGLAVTSHVKGTLTTATFTDLRVGR